MGQRTSKSKSACNGHDKQVWQSDDEPFVWKYEVADLSRSNAADKAVNSLGLPDDVLALIASYCSVNDLGRMAKVCKTWRRVSYSDVIWRPLAQKHEPNFEANGMNAREAALMHFGEKMERDFTYFPFEPEKLLRHDKPKRKAHNASKISFEQVNIFVGADCDGVGKSAFVLHYVCGRFVDEFGKKTLFGDQIS